MIHVVATIETAPGRREAFLEAFRDLVPKVLAEQGCLTYGPTIDVETSIDAQPDARANVVTVMERWESIDALEAHLIAPHMLDYRQRVKDLVVGVELRILKPV